MRRALWILLTPALAFLIIWFVSTRYLFPRLESWALQELHNYSESSLPVKLKVEQIHFKLFKPMLTLEKIHLAGKGDLEKLIPSLEVDNIRVFIDAFHLLSGRLTISAVIVDSPVLKLNIDPLLEDESPAKELPLAELFAQTEKIPLQRILIQNIQTNISSKIANIEFKNIDGSLLLTNMGKNITAKAMLPELDINLASIGHFRGAFDTHLYLTRQALKILQMGIHFNQSDISINGQFSDVEKIHMHPKGTVSASSQINLNDLYSQIKQAAPQLKLPQIAGAVALELETQIDGTQNISAQADITTRGLTIESIEVGDSKIQGIYKDHGITLSEMKIMHPSGDATLTKSQIDLFGRYAFHSHINISNLELQKLFQSLDLNEIPVGLSLQGELPCDGQVFPRFEVTCTNAIIKGNGLWVKSDLKEKTPSIVELNDIKAVGQVRINTDAVNYAAKIQIGETQGQSDGVIDFNKGFKINFKSPQLNFSDIKDLAQLKLEGSTSIEGTTSGDSNSAIFEMNLNTQELVFEGYALGELHTDLKYKSSILYFKNISGQQNKTRFNGEMLVNFNKETLDGDFTASNATLADVAFSIQNTIKFPVDIQGYGTVSAHFDGPLSFWKMNYSLESQFKNVTIGYENFDNLHFNISAKDGNLTTRKVLLQKGSALLNLQGTIDSSQNMNLVAEGKNFKLEELNTFNSGANANIVGNLNFNSEIKQSISNPKVTIKGTISDTLFEEQEIANSAFNFKMDRQSFNGQLNLFGDKVQSEFQFPFEKGTTPFYVKAKSINWNFTSLLGLVGGPQLASEYSSSLNAQIDLKSDSGDIFKSTGKVQVPTFFLKRGPLTLSNKDSVEINFDSGIVRIKNFKLSGPNSYLEIRGDNFTADNLKIATNVNLDLRLLQVFTPFLEELGGEIKVTTTVSGSYKKPEVLGSLQADNAFVKIKGFPHAIERLSTDVVFSQSKIMVNSIKGQIANGILRGEGGMNINGIRDLPTSIRLHLESVNLNVPEKVRTNGSLELLLSGHWFPFLLSGTYHVSGGMIEKEFTEQDSETQEIKQSVYLPQMIREGRFQPINLDLHLSIDHGVTIKNSLLDGSVTGQMQVKGFPSNPLLFGKVTTEKKTKIIFKDKVFDIQNGLIEFNDPREINPNLYISASSRIDDYDINLLAQGPSKNPTIKLTSIPPLPEQDIISLIALGITSVKMDQNLQSKQQAEQLGVEIGGTVLAKPISKRLESTLGLNFQVTSQYDSTRNISVPKFTFSRRLSDKVKVSGSRPVRDNQSYDFKLEYLINNNITAVGSYENRGVEDSTNIQTTQPTIQNIFGLDLEFKREFK